jgi:hypothetical protein
MMSLYHKWYEHPDIKELGMQRGIERIAKESDEFLKGLGFEHIKDTGTYKISNNNLFINNEFVFNTNDEIIFFDTTNSVFSNIIEKTSDKLGFLSYLYGSRMAFDYASNRILVYNPDKSYAYIYKFDNGTVTKLMINNGAKIVTSVIDYPDTIIQDETGALYSLYTKEDISSNDTQQNGLALTRPLKMGGAMSMKAVKQIMSITTHGGKDSFVKYLLYGSNDNVKYYRVSSRFGKPYKFYRVAIYTSLLPKESLSGTVMTIEERRTHKLR